METIQNYLNGVFSAYPQTEALLRLKEELHANMEDRYNALIAVGKSEAEAIGIVLSEFGDMKELEKELELQKEPARPKLILEDIPPAAPDPPRTDAEPLPGNVNPVQSPDPEPSPLPKTAPSFSDAHRVAPEDASLYLDTCRQSGFLIGIGVALFCFGPGLLVFFQSSFSLGFIGLSLLLLFIAAGVGIIVYSGIQMDRVKPIVKKPYLLTPQAEYLVFSRQQADQLFCRLGISIGVCLFILCPVPLIFFSSLWGDWGNGFGVALLLGCVGAGVFCCIFSGTIEDSYKTLLKRAGKGKYFKNADAGASPSVPIFTRGAKERPAGPEMPMEQADPFVNTVISLYWPCITFIFLFLGFLFHLWWICWIIFPLGGLFFPLFISIVRSSRPS